MALGRGDAQLAAREFNTALARLPTTITHLAVARGYLEGQQLEAGLSHIDRAIALEPACAQFAATTPAFAPYRDTTRFRERLAAWKADS